MPKGSKICESCKGVCGPRSFYCKHCQAPFTMHGKEIPKEEIARVKIKKMAVPTIRNDSEDVEDDEQLLEGGFLYDISDHFVEVDYTKDPSNLKYYDGQALCWKSKDNKYRMRYAKTFLGINVDLLHGKRYMIEKVSINRDRKEVWTLVGRFKNAHKAIIGYLNDVNNIVEKPVDIEVIKKRKMRRIIKNNK